MTPVSIYHSALKYLLVSMGKSINNGHPRENQIRDSGNIVIICHYTRMPIGFCNKSVMRIRFMGISFFSKGSILFLGS
jgi:hypothetical protein